MTKFFHSFIQAVLSPKNNNNNNKKNKQREASRARLLTKVIFSPSLPSFFPREDMSWCQIINPLRLICSLVITARTRSTFLTSLLFAN